MRLLVIGDPRGHASAAAEAARRSGADVLFCGSAEEACALLRAGRGVELILADVAKDVPALMRALVSARLPVPVAAFGPEDDARAAAAAMKAGAREYIPLPPDEALVAALLAGFSRSTEERHEAVFRSEAMRAVFALCARVAPTEATVLITGESGSGKEVAARYLHKHSKRANRRMTGLNCAAIPESLLETELFGHEKGAFTGADAKRVGKFEEADGSTLFLDEIGETSALMQAKLLRAVQEKEICRVGGSAPVRADARILAATNKNLQEEVKQRRFREDLYYRLNVIRVHLPPLRDRPEDVPALASAFAARYAALNGVRANAVSPAAEKKLLSYPWPGNVRELENTVHRAVLLAEGDVITPEAVQFTEETMPPAPAKASGYAPPPAAKPGMSLAEIERETVLRTMAMCYGNRAKAAEILGVTARTLRNKLKEYGETAVHEEE